MTLFFFIFSAVATVILIYKFLETCFIRRDDRMITVTISTVDEMTLHDAIEKFNELTEKSGTRIGA